MACPHVSGAAALVLEANPNIKASAVSQVLLDLAERDAITDLKSGDTNALLNVRRQTPTDKPGTGECEGWCSSNSKAWGAKCTWASCSACGQCEKGPGPVPTPPPTA